MRDPLALCDRLLIPSAWVRACGWRAGQSASVGSGVAVAGGRVVGTDALSTGFSIRLPRPMGWQVQVMGLLAGAAERAGPRPSRGASWCDGPRRCVTASERGRAQGGAAGYARSPRSPAAGGRCGSGKPPIASIWAQCSRRSEIRAEGGGTDDGVLSVGDVGLGGGQGGVGDKRVIMPTGNKHPR